MSHPFSSSFKAVQAHFAKRPPPSSSASSPHQTTQMNNGSSNYFPNTDAGQPAMALHPQLPQPLEGTGTASPESGIDNGNPELPASQMRHQRPLYSDDDLPLEKLDPRLLESNPRKPSPQPDTDSSMWNAQGQVNLHDGPTRHFFPQPDSTPSFGGPMVYPVRNTAPETTSHTMSHESANSHPSSMQTDPLLEMQNDLNAETTLRSLTASQVDLGEYFEHNTNEPRQQQSARPGRGRVVKRRGPRKAAEPTGDVKMRLSLASNAYIQGHIDEAIEYCQDAIRINAETHRAWTLLAELFTEKGEHKKCLTARIFAAKLRPKDIDGWLHCAAMAVHLRYQYPEEEEEITHDAIHCYGAALRANIEHKEARECRAALYLDVHHPKLAARDYAFLVERHISDVASLRSLAEISLRLAVNRKNGKLDRPQAVIELYRRCIAYFQDDERQDAEDESFFEWEDVRAFVDLLAQTRQFSQAIFELKSLSRWIMDRTDETFWDDYSGDDREWDQDNLRRSQAPGFDQNRYPSSSYGLGLPLPLRVKLAVLRLKLGQEEEAKLHLDVLDPLDSNGAILLSEHQELMLEIANTLYERDQLPWALQYFEPLLQIPDLLGPGAQLSAGRCYLDIGDKRRAEECFAAAIDSDEQDEASIDARYELAKMYEAAREEREAYILVTEAMKLQGAREEEEEGGTDNEWNRGAGSDSDMSSSDDQGTARTRVSKPKKSRPIKPKGWLNPKASGKKPPRVPRGPKVKSKRPRRRLFGLSEDVEREELRRGEELASKWKEVHAIREQQSSEKARNPSVPFMSAAEALLDDFRSYKDFYSWEKYLAYLGFEQGDRTLVTQKINLQAMAERLSHSLEVHGSGPSRMIGSKQVTGYRGVLFNEWLDLFLEYAIALAHTGRVQEAYKVCEGARDAVVFSNSQEDMFLIHVTWAACALYGRDEETCVAMARYFMSKRGFDTDAFRMFAALSRLCPSPASWYNSGPVQKYIMRQIKIMDRTILATEAGEDSPDEDGEAGDAGGAISRTYPSKELDATLLTLYGHVLFISNSYTYALNYFQRAHSVDPDNPMILLSIGHCYLNYALKRQSENRQYQLAQGFVFLHRYYELRLTTPPPDGMSAAAAASQRQEAHYNLARSYHGIGIPHLAAEYYQRALREGREARKETMAKGSPGTKDVGIDAGDKEEDGVMGSDDLTLEAAYNLQQIYFAGGDMEGMKAITEKYMVI